MQILYQVDLRGEEVIEDLDRILSQSGKSEQATSFAREVVLGTLARLDEEDHLIGQAAEHWGLSRMAAVDRNILRLAVYEMLCRSDVPRKVAINEAIELGKKYSTRQSGAFINGILDRIRASLPEEAVERP